MLLVVRARPVVRRCGGGHAPVAKRYTFIRHTVHVNVDALLARVGAHHLAIVLKFNFQPPDIVAGRAGQHRHRVAAVVPVSAKLIVLRRRAGARRNRAVGHGKQSAAAVGGRRRPAAQRHVKRDADGWADSVVKLRHLVAVVVEAAVRADEHAEGRRAVHARPVGGGACVAGGVRAALPGVFRGVEQFRVQILLDFPLAEDVHIVRRIADVHAVQLPLFRRRERGGQERAVQPRADGAVVPRGGAGRAVVDHRIQPVLTHRADCPAAVINAVHAPENRLVAVAQVAILLVVAEVERLPDVHVTCRRSSGQQRQQRNECHQKRQNPFVAHGKRPPVQIL